MQRQTRADLAMSAALFFLGASLVFSGTSLLRLRWSTTGAAQPLDLAELLGVAGAGAGIALLCWWVLAAICACVSTVARSLGALRIAAFTESCSPAFMRRVVIAVVGANLLAAPLAGAAEGPGIDPLWHADTVVTAPATIPSIAAAERSHLPPNISTGPNTNLSPGQDILEPATAKPVAPQWIPHTGETAPDLLLRPSTRPESSPTEAGSGTQAPAWNIPSGSEPGTSSTSDVVVQKGDSLWSIVSAALGPYSSDLDVALAWPHWYKANRNTIGADPNFIFPGQVLHAPAGH